MYYTQDLLFNRRFVKSQCTDFRLAYYNRIGRITNMIPATIEVKNLKIYSGLRRKNCMKLLQTAAPYKGRCVVFDMSEVQQRML